MSGMLSGITVLELGQVIAGTFAGTILADMGADVIKVEPPRGDESAIHLFMNRGKKSVSLDLKTAGGREVFSSWFPAPMQSSTTSVPAS